MNNLKEIRKTKGLSPSFVAKKLGITYRHFNRIENGQGYLTNDRIKQLSKIYNIPVDNIRKAFKEVHNG